VSSNFLVLNGEVNSESLEVNNDEENQNSGKEVVDVRQARSVESLLKGSNFIRSGNKRVEESNYGTFIFKSVFSSGGHGRESLP